MANHEKITTVPQRRAAANASGLPDRVLEFLRDRDNREVHAWEYSNALDPETKHLPEPQRSEIRNIWFDHLESRDRGQTSLRFSDADVIIVPAPGLIREVFDVALKQAPEAARELLRRNHTALRPFILGTTNDGTLLHLAAEHSRSSILADLMEIIKQYSVSDRKSVVETRDLAGRTVLVIAIQKLNLDAVTILIREQPTLLDVEWGSTMETPLHTAINLAAKQDLDSNRISEIVKAIVEHRPAMLSAHNKEGEPPYCCARKLEKNGSEVCKMITQLLKQYIIRYLWRDIRRVRNAIYGKAEQSKELGLNFSDFNQPSHDFTEFISATCHDGAADNGLEFEHTLFYVVLPDFFHRDNDKFHAEVATLFKWLADRKVTSIIDLVIPDSLQHPMDDDFVQLNILDKFSITSLDWRKLDINVNILTDSAKSKDSLQYVKLYSSGNWSVLFHWTSSDGISKLQKLKSEGRVRVQIVARKSAGSQKLFYPQRLVQYQKEAERLFSAGGLIHSVNVGDLDIAAVNIHGEDPSLESGLGFAADYRDCHDVINAMKSDDPELANLLNQNAVKVAILDNGADKVRLTFSDNIREGISFVTIGDGKYELPYWHCTDPHGAQMASIICGINPDCHLYIARVGTGRNDVDLDSAAMAIDWAIARDVDIISISWTTKSKHKGLCKAIERAILKNILIIASTADEGNLPDEQVYPARWPSVVTVSALDKNNERRYQSQKAVDILVRGEDLCVMGPTYIKDKSLEAITGSSVATAVTVGIASLMLVLVRIVNRKKELWNHFRCPEEIKSLFKLMHTKGNKIEPTILFRDLFKKGSNAWGPKFKHPDEIWSQDRVPIGNVHAGLITREPELFEELVSIPFHDNYQSSRSTTWTSAVSQLSVR